MVKAFEAEQEPVAWQFCLDGKWWNGSEYSCHRQNTEDAGVPTRSLYTTPPTAALAAKQMRDAAVKVCHELTPTDADGVCPVAETIAALPVPSCASNASLEVQWRDLTDEEIADVYEEHWLDHARAVIAKFKEVNT
jgi:hypothetical protein